MTEQPHYDPWQFYKPSRAATAESRLSFADIKTMHVYRRSPKPASDPPLFVNNPFQLRHVLAQMAFSYAKIGCCRGEHVPNELVNDLPKLIELTQQRFTKDFAKRDMTEITHDRHVATNRAAGSYLHLLASVVYLSWKLRFDSVQVAEDLRSRRILINPPNVRIMLHRMRHTAKQLGYDAVTPRCLTARKAAAKREYTTRRKLPLRKELLAMFEECGRSTRALAERFNVHQYSVYRALRRAGPGPLRIIGRKYERTAVGVKMTALFNDGQRGRPRRLPSTAELLELRKTLSGVEIAKRYGVTASHLYAVIRKAKEKAR